MAKEGVGGVRPSLAGGPPFFSSTPRAQKGCGNAAAVSLAHAHEQRKEGRGKGLARRGTAPSPADLRPAAGVGFSSAPGAPSRARERKKKRKEKCWIFFSSSFAASSDCYPGPSDQSDGQD